MKDTYEEYLNDTRQEIIGLELHHKKYGWCEVVDAFVMPYTPEGMDKLVLGLKFPEDSCKKYLASIFLAECDENDDAIQTIGMCDAMLYDLAKAHHDAILTERINRMELKLAKEREAKEAKEREEKEKKKANREKRKAEKSTEKTED